MNFYLRFPLALLIVLLAASPAFAQYPLNVGGPQNDVANATHYDDLGNTYLAGAFRGVADFDPSALTLSLGSAGNTDAFVASYGPGGNVRWAFSIGTPGREVANDVIHQDGVLYVTGQYEGTPDFDPSSGVFLPPSGGGLDAFVAAYDVTGISPIFLWVAPIFGPDDQIGQDLDIHPSPPFNVWVTGSLVDNADFGGSVLAATGTNSDIFVAGYDAAGGVLYDAFLVGDTGLDEGLGISLLRPNLPCITGRFRNTVDFDPSGGVFLLSSVANDDGFIACYIDIPAGTPTLFAPFNAVQISGPSVQRGYDIHATFNSIHVTGTFVATTNFNGPSFPSNGSADAFVAAYDLSGAPQWVIPFGGPQVDAGLGIDADDCGNVYATGTFRAGPVDFDPFVLGTYDLPTFANYDAWVASYDALGNFRFANRIARNQRDVGYGVAVKPTSGAHLAAGEFAQTPVFSSGNVVTAAAPITSNGNRDGYLAAYNTNGALQLSSCPAPPSGLEVWTDYDAFSGGFYLDLASLTSPANNGTPIGSVVTGPGVVGLAANFPTTGDHIDIAPDPSLAVNTDDLTVDAWVQIDPAFSSDFFTIVSNFDPASRDGYEVMLRRFNNTDWVINVTIGDGTIGIDLTSPPFLITPSTWRFIAVTVDHGALATTATFYVDGLPFATATGVPLGPITYTGPMYQHRSAQFGAFDELGWLDEVEVFHALLSADEIERIARFGKCKPCFTAPFQPMSRAANDEVLDVDFAPEAPSTAATPEAFALAPTRPNPFRGQAEIGFSLPEDGPVRLQVFDMMGRRIATLVDEVRAAGSYSVRFDAGRLPSGVYIVRFESGGQTATQRMTLVR